MSVCLIVIVLTAVLSGQTSMAFQYFYDDLGQLTKVIDSTGIEIDYIYDPVGNILQIKRGTAPTGVAIFNFNPQQGPSGTSVTIQGQNFNPDPAQDLVQFNGVTASVLSATTTTIVATVPDGATTGPISVTVNSQKATSTDSFTVLSVPTILSLNPRFEVSSSNAITIPSMAVTGTNLTNSTFAFGPIGQQSVLVKSFTIDPSGKAATLTVTIAPNTLGNFVLIATNGVGSSSQVSNGNNTLQVIDPNGDADGDGLTNAFEIAIGTDPVNPDSDADGMPDGWEVFYGLNPKANDASGDPDNDGLSNLQEYQGGTNPRNPNRLPPAVSSVIPKDGATAVPVNSLVVLRFDRPTLTGTSFAAALAAIKAANSGLSDAQIQIAAQTLQSYLNRTCCGNSVILGNISLAGPSGNVPGNVMASDDAFSATFAPTGYLQATTQYTVNVNGIRDAAGNLMKVPFSSSFTTGTSLDQNEPGIQSTVPANGAYGVPLDTTVSVTFSKAMDPGSITANSFTLFDITAKAAVPGSVQVDSTDTMATLVPAQQLPANHAFSVTLTSAIRDQANNHLSGNPTFGFSTSPPPPLEADSLTFSILNSSSISSSTQAEADSLTFSLLNGSSMNSPLPAEADSLTFSLLNGNSMNSPVPAEADSSTFSLLNGEAEMETVTHEADSLTFSLHNLSQNRARVTSPANATPASGSPAVSPGGTASAPSGAGKGQINLPAPTPINMQEHEATLVPAFHISILSRVLNRLLHLGSQPKPGAAFRSQTLAKPSGNHSSHKSPAGTRSTRAEQGASCPAAIAGALAIQTSWRTICR